MLDGALGPAGATIKDHALWDYPEARLKSVSGRAYHARPYPLL